MSAPGPAIFLPEGDRFVPTEHARGPWDPRALHGGAPAALITWLFERVPAPPGVRIARLGFELLRPVPSEPLVVSTSVPRDGRRVQELAAEVHAGGQLICRASALRVQEVPAGLPVGAEPPEPMAAPERARPITFTLEDAGEGAGFAATGMEMRAFDDPDTPGPARVWMRLRQPLLPGVPATPLATAAATADFGNGVSAVLPFADYIFINADLTLHLHRPPRGEWTGLDARTILHAGGTGLSECVLHDVDGPVGRSFQALVVQPR